MIRYFLALLLTFGFTSAMAADKFTDEFSDFAFARAMPESDIQRSDLFETSTDSALISEEENDALIEQTSMDSSVDDVSYGSSDAQIILAKTDSHHVPSGRRTYCHTQSGGASYYSLPGRRTASGTPHNPNSMTAAHRSLPFGYQLKVTNLANGKSVVVAINDRGPFVGGRVIDLSKASFARIASTSQGVARVKIESVHCLN